MEWMFPVQKNEKKVTLVVPLEEILTIVFLLLAVLGKKMRIWERRLMKDFKVAPVATEEDMDSLMYQPPPENEDSIAKYEQYSQT